MRATGGIAVLPARAYGRPSSACTGRAATLRCGSRTWANTPIALKRDDAVAVDDSRYLVLGEIGRGGVGIVYRGRDRDLNRDVALKVLRADHAENPTSSSALSRRPRSAGNSSIRASCRSTGWASSPTAAPTSP